MNSRCLKLYRAYSISFNSSNVGKCFWSWILKDCIKVQEKKRKLLSCVPVLDKTWIQTFSRCSRATTAKKCTKKAWCTCKVVVLLIKPIAFLPFSLPSASALLKLPITVEPLLWDTSIQGTPPFRRHKIWSQKSAHIIFESMSGALWVRKCGKLPIRENLVIMWLYTGRPPNRPSTPQASQCKITHSTGMATQM